MATPPSAHDKLNKVVVACVDSRRLKGYVYDFSPLKESFRLSPQNDPLKGRGTEIALKDLKAVFFVKEFDGNPEHLDSKIVESGRHGRRIEVIFSDQETIVGTTEAYNPQKLGFFLFPADPKSNNVRIFVVNRNVEKIKVF